MFLRTYSNHSVNFDSILKKPVVCIVILVFLKNHTIHISLQRYSALIFTMDGENSNNTEKLPLNQPTLNPMVFHQGFQHITEQIFEKMDEKNLKNCREVAKSWQNCIDNQNILWIKMAKKNGGTKSFQLACKNGHFKMAKMVIQKATEIKN